MRRILIISMFVGCAFSLHGQVVSVKSEISKDTIALGEQAVYRFTVESGPKTFVEIPIFYDSISSHLEILSMVGTDTLNKEAKRIITSEYLVTSFEKGMNTISPKGVRFSYGEYTDTAYSLPVLIMVTAPQVDTSLAIKPIKPPVNTPVSLAEILPWVGIGYGALLLITLIVALIWIVRKRKENPGLFQIKPKEPAHVTALRSLDQLRDGKLIESSQAKQYYTVLTEIIRRYISDQYGLQAMESISSEILEEFKMVNRDKEELNDMLADLLQLADLVKFAKEDPLRKEKEKHLHDAYIFVEETHAAIERLRNAEEEATTENIGYTDKQAEKLMTEK